MASTPYGTFNFGYTDPTHPPPQTEGGNWLWDALKGAWSFLQGNAGDILKTGGAALEGYMSSEDRAKALAEQKREYDANLAQRKSEQQTGADQFARTTGDTEAQAAVRAQTQVNKAPIADKAQALILARMGVSPGAFRPRDFTQGLSSIDRSFTAPGAPVASATQRAASSYTPGSGGVDTSVIQALLTKLVGSSGLNVGRPNSGSSGGAPVPSFPNNTPYPITPPRVPVTPPPTIKPLPQPSPSPAPLAGSDNGTGASNGGGDPNDPNDPRALLLRRMSGQAVY